MQVADRSQRVSPSGWALLRQALEHLGPVPTAMAWDSDLPGLAVMLDEVRLASELMAEVGADGEETLELVAGLQVTERGVVRVERGRAEELAIQTTEQLARRNGGGGARGGLGGHRAR